MNCNIVYTRKLKWRFVCAWFAEMVRDTVASEETILEPNTTEITEIQRQQGEYLLKYVYNIFSQI